MNLEPEVIKFAEMIQEQLNYQKESNLDFAKKFNWILTEPKISKIVLYISHVHEKSGHIMNQPINSIVTHTTTLKSNGDKLWLRKK